MNKRKKLLLKVAVDILNELNGLSQNSEEVASYLRYDGVEVDLSCLADDIVIEFDI